jgi:hypothetical protein
LKIHGMNKIGNKIILSISEFGINDIHVTVIALKPTKLDTSKIDWSKRKSRPAIGTFKRYAPVVNTYTFKDLSRGEISKINATPNHPFYVKNKTEFIAIEDVSPTDELVDQTGKQVRLVCHNGKSDHCGKLYNAKPVPVYNLEVYKKHVYYVGCDGILVHNVYSDDEVKDIFHESRHIFNDPSNFHREQQNSFAIDVTTTDTLNFLTKDNYVKDGKIYGILFRGDKRDPDIPFADGFKLQHEGYGSVFTTSDAGAAADYGWSRDLNTSNLHVIDAYEGIDFFDGYDNDVFPVKNIDNKKVIGSIQYEGYQTSEERVHTRINSYYEGVNWHFKD